MDGQREFKRIKRGQLDTFLQELDKCHETYFPQMDDETILPIELTNATGTYFDHLNDDCLLEIFSKSLSPMELLALAETCKLFKRVAPRAFPKKLAVDNRDQDVWYGRSNETRVIRNHRVWYEWSKDQAIVRKSALVVEKIFENFGSCLETLSIYCLANCLLNLIVKHCVIGTLKELQIEATGITDVLAFQLKPFFIQLQLLSIVNVTIPCSANLFANCDSLIELRIWEVPNSNGILENNFPKLQRFSFCNFYKQGEFNSDFLLNFLERHKALKCLHLNFHRLRVDGFLRKLGDVGRELEEFAIVFDDGTLDVSIFPNLKQLSVYGRFNIIAQLQKLKLLESLEINNYSQPQNSEEIFRALPLLTNLRELSVSVRLLSGPKRWKSWSHLTKLRLSYCYSGSTFLVYLIRDLTKLEELEIYSWDFVLSEKKFHEIVEVVKGRSRVLTLKCRFDFDLSDEYTFKIGEETLRVKLINNIHN